MVLRWPSRSVGLLLFIMVFLHFSRTTHTVMIQLIQWHNPSSFFKSKMSIITHGYRRRDFKMSKKKRKLKADSVTVFYWLMRYMYIQHKDALQELENNTGHWSTCTSVIHSKSISGHIFSQFSTIAFSDFFFIVKISLPHSFISLKKKITRLTNSGTGYIMYRSRWIPVFKYWPSRIMITR